MINASYPFKIGEFECVVISDGSITVPTPEYVMNQRAGISTEVEWMFPDINCLLIRAGVYKVLVETGCGSGMESTPGKLFENLNTAGIESSEIDKVIFTHAHRDHIGGNVDAGGRPAFVNARYMMHRKEWEYWMDKLRTEKIDAKREFDDGMKENLLAVKRNMLPIRDRVDLLRDDMEVVPGIKYIATPGHTPGSIVFVISSGVDRLWCIGDLMHRELDIEEGVRILPGLAESGALVFACHFKFPGLGKIIKKGNRLVWQPVNLPI